MTTQAAKTAAPVPDASRSGDGVTLVNALAASEGRYVLALAYESGLVGPQPL